jgi:hypothetical protein
LEDNPVGAGHRLVMAVAQGAFLDCQPVRAGRIIDSIITLPGIGCPSLEVGMSVQRIGWTVLLGSLAGLGSLWAQAPGNGRAVQVKPGARQPMAPEARVALVIGNDSYRHLESLRNARSDARAIAAGLTATGFQVTLRTDLDEKAMKEALRSFKNQIRGGDVAVFYYSGHGVQLGGNNLLLPVDIRGESEDQVRDEAIPLQRVLDDLQEQKAKFSLAIVDACRTNPFKGQGRSIGGRGLAPTTAATGQMVLFSAGTGQEALDRLGPGDTNPNGLFTRVLIREMRKPGLPADRVLRNVREEVVRLARGVGQEQVPALYDQSLGDFYFVPDNPGTASSAAPVLPSGSSLPSVPPEPAPRPPAAPEPVVPARPAPVGLSVLVHLQDLGDKVFPSGQWAGTKGQSRRLEGLSLTISPPVPGLSLEYMAHLEDYGDVPWVPESTFCGTRGLSRRLEGFAIRLTGPRASDYDVVYYGYLEGMGDTGPYANGAFCGTRGQSRRCEAIWVTVQPK